MFSINQSFKNWALICDHYWNVMSHYVEYSVCVTCLTSACRWRSCTHCSRRFCVCSALTSSSCCFSLRNSNSSWTWVARSTSFSPVNSIPAYHTQIHTSVYIPAESLFSERTRLKLITTGWRCGIKFKSTTKQPILIQNYYIIDSHSMQISFGDNVQSAK